MLIYLFIFLQSVFVTAKEYDAPVFDPSENNTFRHIWHSYNFNTGIGNREELYFSKAELDNNFESTSGIFQWKNLPATNQIIIAGLGHNFVSITQYDGNSKAFTFREELEDAATGIAMFKKWNARKQDMENFLIVATYQSRENYVLKWYHILDKYLKFLWDWPFKRNITYLDVVKINYEPKLLVVSHKENNMNSSADIYNFNIDNDIDIWLFERIILEAVPSSVSTFESNDSIYVAVSFLSLESVQIYIYSKSLCLQTFESKHFMPHQLIFSSGLKSFIVFRVGFRWYLAVAGQPSLIYYMGDNFLFQPLNNLQLGSLNNFLAIPVSTYREDVILLADSDHNVIVISWNGNEDMKVLGSFNNLVCEEDTHCLNKLKKITLNESTAFEFNGREKIIMSTQEGNPLFFILDIKLKPVPDKTTLKVIDILNKKSSLKDNYTDQTRKINQLLSKSRSSDSINFLSEVFGTKEIPQTVSQIKNESSITSSINYLESLTESLSRDIKTFFNYLKINILTNNADNSDALLAKNITDSITFHGEVFINELKFLSLNGYNIHELLTDSFRKNRKNKVGGRKIIKDINAEKVEFEKLNNISAKDLFFSDDLLEDKNKNTINGDIILEKKFKVLNNINILFLEANKQNNSLTKLRGSSKYVYDVVFLEDLEVSQNIVIQKTLNGKLFLLPVHSGQFNILDVVNQARIEVANVKHNLEVDVVNGKNFSDLVKKIMNKSPFKKDFETLKIDGILKTDAMETNRLNNVDLSIKPPEVDREQFSKKLLINDRNFYTVDNIMKKANVPSGKRVIHVFQNLVVNGVVFSNKINHISWATLNDTVRKNSERVTFTGSKKFDALKSKKITLRGTLNGRFADHILNDFSDQTITFPQTFNVVEFKNISVHGSWDNISVTYLNESLVRLSSGSQEATDLKFESECFINALHVSDYINGNNVKFNSTFKNKLNGKIELDTMKVGNIVLYGNLITNDNINNVNLTSFSLARVSLTNPQNVEKNFTHDNLTVSQNLHVESVNLNDVSSVINSRGDTKLIGKFLNGEIHRIKKLLVKGNITTSYNINSYNVSQIIENAVCITKPGLIKGKIIFENVIYFDNINVPGSIDGFSLKKLEKDIAFKHNRVFLNGPKNFSYIKVNKNMKARSLNGHLMEDILTLKGDENIQSEIQINGDVVVKENITTYASINDITVPDLLRTFSTNINSFIYSGNLNVLSDQVVINNLVVDGYIQNVSLDALINDTVLKKDGFFVSGKKIFKGEVKFMNNVVAEGLIHGLNFSQLYSDLVFINKPSKLVGTTIIDESIFKVLNTNGDFNSTLINNFDTNDWVEDCISLDKYDVIDGKKTFISAYSVQDIAVDIINDHLPTAMISLTKKQYIPIRALFPRIHSQSDFSVGGFVNQKNLETEFHDTILVSGDQRISGKLLFNEDFVIHGNLIVNTINGKTVHNLITLDGEQTIRAPLEFDGVVRAKKDVEDLKVINNISLEQWHQNSVLVNKKQVLNGLWTIKGELKARNIDGEGLLHAVSLRNVSKDFQYSRLNALEIKNATNIEYLEQCQKVENLSGNFSKFPYLFYQFDIAGEIETLSVIESVITFKIQNVNYLIITLANECFSSLYKWNHENETYEYRREINIGPVNKWSVLYHHEATYLITSSLKNSLNCEDNLLQSNVWVFNGKSDKYIHLLGSSAFVDIVHENNTSNQFFTIDEKGILQKWTLEKNGNVSSNFLMSVGPSNYRFIDFKIMGGLAISNGREIKQITLTEDKVIENNISLINANIVALPLNGRTLIAVVMKDKIVVYENILEDKIFSVIHTYRAGSVLWFNYGAEKQAFLIVASHHKLIEVYEYKSVSGLVKKMSIQMFSSRLQSEALPSKYKYQPNKYVFVIQRKKLIFVKADMIGDFFRKTKSFC